MAKHAALECLRRALPLALAISACTTPAAAESQGSSDATSDREVFAMKVRLVIRARGLVKLGKLDSGFDVFEGDESLEVTIQSMEK